MIFCTVTQLRDFYLGESDCWLPGQAYMIAVGPYLKHELLNLYYDGFDNIQ